MTQDEEHDRRPRTPTFRTNSPLERLFPIVQGLANANTALGAGTAIRQAFAPLVGIDQGDLVALHRAYSRTLALADAAVLEVTGLVDDPRQPTDERERLISATVAPVHHTRQLLAQTGVGGTVGTLQGIPVAALQQLRPLAMKHAQQAPDVAEPLREIAALLEELEQELEAPSLQAAVRERLLQELADLRRALDEYATFGDEATRDPTGRLALTLMWIRTNAASSISAADWEKLGRLINLAAALDLAYRASVTAMPLISAGTLALNAALQ